MHEVVALMDVSDVGHIPLQNLQVVDSSQVNVLGEEKSPHLPLFPLKAPHTITISEYFTVLTVN